MMHDQKNIKLCITEFQKWVSDTLSLQTSFSIKCQQSRGTTLLHIVTCYELLASQVLLTEYEVKITGGEIQTLRRATHDHTPVNSLTPNNF